MTQTESEPSVIFREHGEEVCSCPEDIDGN